MRQTVVVECPQCKGTGILVGGIAKAGAAIICYHCGGTGAKTVSYEAFEGRKVRDDVKRVFNHSGGHILYGDDIVTPEGEELHFSEYGCSYQDWLKGERPIPMMELICPYESTNPCIGIGPCTRCATGLRNYGPINQCEFYHDKKACWEEWLKLTDNELIAKLTSK